MQKWNQLFLWLHPLCACIFLSDARPTYYAMMVYLGYGDGQGFREHPVLQSPAETFGNDTCLQVYFVKWLYFKPYFILRRSSSSNSISSKYPLYPLSSLPSKKPNPTSLSLLLLKLNNLAMLLSFQLMHAVHTM